MKTDIFDGFPRGAGSEETQAGPSARFMTEAEILSEPQFIFHPQNTEGKTFLGVTGSAMGAKTLSDGRLEKRTLDGTPIGIPDDRHILTVAGSRAGKGRSAVIPNLITYPGSMLVIDPKGELAQKTADWRAEALGQKVVVLDPFGAAGEVTERYGAGFNPMSILDEDSPTLVEDAGLIADALIKKDGNKGDPHWDESAQQFLEAVILHVATNPAHAEYDARNLLSVYKSVMTDLTDTEMGLCAEMKENPAANGEVYQAAEAFFSKDIKELSSILSSLRRHIRFLGYQQMRDTLIEHRFELAELKDSNLTVYLSLPVMRMGTCSRWLRLFVNMTLAAMEKDQRSPEYPVLMCLDEFATLGHMQSLENASGQIAGLGCKLWPIVQDIGQMEQLYGKRWETFVGNSGILQFFGNSDAKTLQWISQRLGSTTIQTRSQSNQTYKAKAVQGASGLSFGQQVHPLMTPEEVSRFFARDNSHLRQLIFYPGKDAMVLQRAYNDSHPYFKAYQDFMGIGGNNE